MSDFISVNVSSDGSLIRIVCIADDIGVVGENDVDHNENLENLLKRCALNGIKLNSSPEKLHIHTDQLMLHGHVFTKHGILPDK